MENNFITPEEAGQSVTYGHLIVMMQEFIKAADANAQRADGIYWNEVTRVANSLFAGLQEAEYRRARDIHFLLTVFADMNVDTRDNLIAHYNSYCAEFDKLNRSNAANNTDAVDTNEEE